MTNPFYQFAYFVSQYIRSRNYKLYRWIVEAPFFQKCVLRFFRKSHAKVTTPENYELVINPLYHGNFLTEVLVAQYEPMIREFFDEWVKEGMVVYDVGANVGIFSMLFVKKVGVNGAVYAFEPEENNYQCLYEAKKHNRLDNFEVEPKCVAEISGTQMFDHRGGAFSGRIVESKEASHQDNVTPIDVVSLDDFIFQGQHRAPDLVKIDVEGNEGKVIKGMKQILDQHKPLILCEIHLSLDPSVVEIQPLLEQQGYRLYDLNDWLAQKREPLTSIKDSEHIIAQYKID